MKKSIVKTAKTTEIAIKEALDELKLSRDEVEIEVLEEEKSGFFGIIGQKEAVVKISYEESAMEELKDIEESILNDSFDDIKVNFDPKKYDHNEDNLEDNEELSEDDYDEEIIKEDYRENEDQVDIKESEKDNEDGNLNPLANEKLKDEKELSDVEKYYKAKDLLGKMIDNMHIENKIYGNLYDDIIKLEVKVDKDDTGILIGRNAKTLDSIEFLLRRMINGPKNSPKITVDVNNYKKRRDDKIRNYANRIAHKVIRNKKYWNLRYMNSYERRLIHKEISKYDKLTSSSVGKDPKRYVVISYVDK